MGKLINRIPGFVSFDIKFTRLGFENLLISSLPGSASRMHVESLGKPRDVNKRSRQAS